MYHPSFGVDMIQVSIIDSHKVLSDTLKLVLDWETGFELVGAASDMESARRLVKNSSPHVLLMDVFLPDGDGFELIPLIREASPVTNIVILTSAVEDALVLRAIEQNVQGILTKSCTYDELLSCIRAAAQGELAIPNYLLAGVLRRQANKTVAIGDDDYLWEKLTHREMDVLNCLALGQSSKAIASQLHITPLTVRTHIRNLMSKLGAHTRLEAVTFALSRGIIQAPY